jgi:hypothetical protein
LPASGRRKTPKGGDVSFPLWKRGIEGDFMAILLISLAFEIHFSKGQSDTRIRILILFRI